MKTNRGVVRSSGMDVYDYIRQRTAGSNEGVPISVREIAENTGLALRTTREQIARLVIKGYVSVDPQWGEDGGQRPSLYRITGLPSGSPAQAELVRAIYARYVAEREGKRPNAFTFLNSRPQFEKIAAICDELDMDVHAYILSCFYCMPAGWCRKTFKNSYPPPHVVASKTKARERYDNFLRQFRKEDPKSEGPKTEIIQSIHFIRSLKLECDVPRMIDFVRNGAILQEVFMSMPSTTKADWKDAGIDERKLDVALLKMAHKAVYEEFIRRKS